jgi:hypothetical protein
LLCAPYCAGWQSLGPRGLIGLRASKLLIKDNSFAQVKLPHLNIMLPKTTRHFQWLRAGPMGSERSKTI